MLISGLMTDAYGEKSAVLSWLIPTKSTDTSTFDPSSFILGKIFKLIPQ